MQSNNVPFDHSKLGLYDWLALGNWFNNNAIFIPISKIMIKEGWILLSWGIMTQDWPLKCSLVPGLFCLLDVNLTLVWLHESCMCYGCFFFYFYVKSKEHLNKCCFHTNIHTVFNLSRYIQHCWLPWTVHWCLQIMRCRRPFQSFLASG